MRLSLTEVAWAVGGSLVGDGEARLTSVSTDTRDLSSGALYVALAGPRFNGHDFVRGAFATGASAALVGDPSCLPDRAAAVVVPDTLRALQRLAAWHRRQMPALVIALTGSVGKTTTKDLAAAVLARAGSTLFTRGNLNNHIGVPLTLLRLEPEHRFAVIEMGCNGFGEIELLAGIAAPTIGLVTRVAEAHLEGLGDLDGVARAKGELLASLPVDGTAVVNLDDPRVRAMRSPARRRIGYGEDSGADVRLSGREPGTDGTQRLELALPGRTVRPRLGLLGAHNARNAAAAAALAVAAGIEAEHVEAGLGDVLPAAGRLVMHRDAGALRVIDDTYNANPGSVAAALDVLREHRGSGGAHVLLGEMAELGGEREAAHRRIGALAARLGVTTLIGVEPAAGWLCEGAVGAGMDRGAVLCAASPEEAARLVEPRAAVGDVVLVKGSRVAQMERAVTVLRRGGGR